MSGTISGPALRHDFSGKVAIVTGAAQGIGEAYARALAAAGAAVVVADINAEAGGAVVKDICAAGGRAAFSRTDVSDPASAAAMAVLAVAEFGGIDLLVNNAAIYGEMKFDLLISVSWDYYKQFLGVNMDGALVCTRACYRQMAERGGGAIVNQSSTAAWLYSGFYGLAKAGVNSLTQQLAHELGGMGIRVNAIAPGPTDTAATRAVTGGVAQDMVKSFALKRMGQPGDLVGACLFLLSGEAAWITGQIFNVDGGQVFPVTAAEAPAVGFIGLGQMGQPMAARLAAWPGGLVVHDVRPAAMTPLAEAGATAAGSVAEVAQRAGIISVMVRDDDQVRDVVPQVAAAAKAAGGPAIIAIHSTIGPGTAADLAARYGVAGIEIVDAPVSGGFMGAQDGRLVVMMGSSRAAYERCREPFGCFADLVLHLGPAGAGTQAKLARNLLHFVAFSAAAEAQRLAEAAGLDLRKLAGVVRHSDAVTGGPGSIMLRRTTAPLAPDDPLRPILEHVRALGEKDLSLALELGAQLGVDLPLAEHARRHFAAGLGLPPGEDPAEDPGEDPGADSGELLVAEAGGDAEATPRARGLAMMSEVYGWDVQDGPGDWFGITVEHLFGSIWTRPGLTMRDRRLLLLGLLVGQGQQDVADIQIGAALRRGELSPDALREIAIFLTHYVGWPGGARLSMQVEQLITQQAKE